MDMEETQLKAQSLLLQIAVDELKEFPIIKQLLEIDGVVLAGGALRDQIKGEQIAKDYDFFFTKPGAEQQAREILGKSFIYTRYTATFIVNNHSHLPLGLSHSNPNLNDLEIQLVFKKIYESPQEIIDQFDFRVCQFAADKNGVYFNPEAYDDLDSKRLVANNITKPIDSLNRLVKYAKKGYDVNEAYQKVVEVLAKTPVQNIPTFYGGALELAPELNTEVVKTGDDREVFF
jgi:hypothetical protein